MGVTDFTNSYMTFFAHGEGNIARIQLDAACTLVDEADGTETTYYLIAPCRSERMYLDRGLFSMPNYEFCGIWSNEEHLIIRTHWASENDNREHGRNRERFAEVSLDIRAFEEAQALCSASQIVEATLRNLPLVARTELRDEGGELRATLEYPVKTMNVLREPPRFQVDTGPLILPDITSVATAPIARFDVAHVAYNAFDKTEFVLRRPVSIAPDGDSSCSTTDHSVVRVVPARNNIFCAGSAGHGPGVAGGPTVHP